MIKKQITLKLNLETNVWKKVLAAMMGNKLTPEAVVKDLLDATAGKKGMFEYEMTLDSNVWADVAEVLADDSRVKYSEYEKVSDEVAKTNPILIKMANGE